VERFGNVEKEVKKLYDLVDLLKEKLGCVLFQTPPSFHYKEEHLKRIVELLNPKYNNVVEFRHRSWWIPEVVETLKKHEIIFGGTSGMNMPNEFYPARDTVYARLHGNKTYSRKYTTPELKYWATEILDKKPKKIYIYFDNDRNGYAPDNAQELIEILEARLGITRPKKVSSAFIADTEEIILGSLGRKKVKLNPEIEDYQMSIEDDTISQSTVDVEPEFSFEEFQKKYSFKPKNSKKKCTA